MTIRHQLRSGQMPAVSPRLVSLDVFRGAAIAAMILVNNAGDEPSSYRFLKHAEWNGCTPADLVFPFFIFIVGVAIPFSASTGTGRQKPRTGLLRYMLWRSLILFVLGVFLNGFPNRYSLPSLRVYGILQRIAICYLVSAGLAVWTRPRSWALVAIACLTGYWILMRYVPVPGLGIPTHMVPLLDPDRNLAAWLDRRLLGSHLYDGTHDPEGLLSTIPAIATCISGLLTGHYLRGPHFARTKLLFMTTFGLACIAAGELWNVWFPINKPLWTSSFALFAAGIALLCLSLCYLVLDVRQWRGSWATLLMVFGRNAIAAYIFAELLANVLFRMHTPSGDTLQDAIYIRLFDPLAAPPIASLLYALSYLLLCWMVMWLLYRKGIFIKV